MKASELMKLNVGDTFLMNQAEGPETCTIYEIRKGDGWHQIHFRSGRGEATIHIAVSRNTEEELGAISLPE